ncbi:MAG: hypothetical protein ACLQVX_00600 [Limisphaerales bacterium]
MTRPVRIQYPGAVYHVMARGNQGREVFRDNEDPSYLKRARSRMEGTTASLVCRGEGFPEKLRRELVQALNDGD